MVEYNLNWRHLLLIIQIVHSKLSFNFILISRYSCFLTLFRDYESIYNIIQSESSEKLKQYLKSETQLQEYPVPVIEMNGKK